MRQNFTHDELAFVDSNYSRPASVFTQVKAGFVFDLTKKIEDVLSFVPESKRYRLKVQLWHIVNDVDEQSCKECGRTLPVKYMKYFDEVYPYKREYCSSACKFFGKSKVIHDDKYSYDDSVYESAHSDIEIECPIHGKFYQKPHNHVLGTGCVVCRNDDFKENYSHSQDQWIEKFRAIHGNTFDYSDISINEGSNTTLILTCDDHGPFEVGAYKHSVGQGCVKCVMKSQSSKEETEVFEYVNSITDEVVVGSDRSVLQGKELDIIVPSSHIAIEYNGVYWHSDIHVDKNYHLNKTKLCEDADIDLYHIFSNEWLNPKKKDIWKSIIANALGATPTRVYARKCEVVSMDNYTAEQFFNENHLQGYANSSFRYGLMYDGEIVCSMTFSKSRYSKEGFELVRFANKLNTSVIGGASRLMKTFIKNVCPERIVSYSDRRISKGNMYQQLGFTYSHTSKPNYFYTKDFMNLEPRVKYQKHKLKDVLDDYDESLSERDNMIKNRYSRIYDCGNMVWIWES